MNLMVVLYMVGAGLQSASCALIGQNIGKSDVTEAKNFYITFRYVSALIIVFVIYVQYMFHEEIIAVYTDKTNI